MNIIEKAVEKLLGDKRGKPSAAPPVSIEQPAAPAAQSEVPPQEASRDEGWGRRRRFFARSARSPGR